MSIEDFMFEDSPFKKAELVMGEYYCQGDYNYLYYEEYNKIIMVSNSNGIYTLPDVYYSVEDEPFKIITKEKFEQELRNTIFELGLYKYFKPID